MSLTIAQIEVGGTGVGSVTTAPSANQFAGWDSHLNLSANNFLPGFQSIATAAGTTSLVVGSPFLTYFTGSTTQTCKMPVVSGVAQGQQFKIINLSSGVVTVQSSGSNVIQAMASDTQLVLTCISTSGTGIASWDWEYLPVQAPLPGVGTVTSVAFSVPGSSLFGVSGSPVTSSGTLGLTTTGTSGGIPYFSSSSQLNSSAALTASQLVIGGGAGAAPSSLAAGTQNFVLIMGASNPGYGQIVNASVSASAGIDFSKLAALSSGNILVGSAGNVASSVAMTGDVTISNAGVTAIGSNKVTLGMMAQISTQTFLGRTSASTGNVEDLTATQATAILNEFVGDSGSGGTKGLVVAPSTGDASKFLRGDATWAVPSAGITNVVDTFSGDGSTVAFTLSGSVATANTLVYISGIYQNKAGYSVSGSTLTFTSAPPVGTNNVEVNSL